MTYIKWPCIFANKMIREDVNPRLPANTPFGAFQRAWRSEHCSQLDFYGTGACPYAARDCVLAYYQTADRSMREARTSPVGLFRKLARAYGAQRADDKPRMRTDGNQTRDAARPVGRGDDEGRDVRSRRLRRIGDLFGEDDS